MARARYTARTTWCGPLMADSPRRWRLLCPGVPSEFAPTRSWHLADPNVMPISEHPVRYGSHVGTSDFWRRPLSVDRVWNEGEAGCESHHDSDKSERRMTRSQSPSSDHIGFNPAMILFNTIVQISACPVLDRFSELLADRARITVMSIRCHARWCDTGDRPG